MPIHLENLDSITRNYMLSEVNMDFEKDSIYYSKYLKSGLEDSWNNIFIKAVIEHNDVWLEQQTEIQELLVKTYQKRNPTGGFTTAKVPYTAPQTLAEGEFNRFYCRGLCVRAIKEGKMVQVYRGKNVANARSESKQMIGQIISPKELLDDLRTNVVSVHRE